MPAKHAVSKSQAASVCRFAILRKPRSLPDAGIEAIARVELLIERRERGLRVVKVTDVVFSRIFGTATVEQGPHLVFDGEAVMAFLYDVVLVKDVTQKVAVIQLDRDRFFDIGR
jgi:hypothetical protein